MARMDMERCYGCGDRIGFLRSTFRPREATFESALEGHIEAAFCSARCHHDAVTNAATIHAIGLGHPSRAPAVLGAWVAT